VDEPAVNRAIPGRGWSLRTSLSPALAASVAAITLAIRVLYLIFVREDRR